MKNMTHIFRTMFIICAFVAIGMSSIARAEVDGGISIAGKVSTLGLGAELKYPFHKKFNGRLVLNRHNLKYDKAQAGNQNVGNLKLNTFGLIGDWHPTGDGFRLSLGLLSNKNKLSASTEGGNYEYNNRQYTGRSNILLDFKSIAPYFGVGWSSQKKSGWSVDFEVGALFQGTPRLSGSGTATGAGNACNFTVNTGGVATVTGGNMMLCVGDTTIESDIDVTRTMFKTDIEAEHRELQRSLNKFKLYPVLSLGIQYRF